MGEGGAPFPPCKSAASPIPTRWLGLQQDYICLNRSQHYMKAEKRRSELAANRLKDSVSGEAINHHLSLTPNVWCVTGKTPTRIRARKYPAAFTLATINRCGKRITEQGATDPVGGRQGGSTPGPLLSVRN